MLCRASLFVVFAGRRTTRFPTGTTVKPSVWHGWNESANRWSEKKKRDEEKKRRYQECKDAYANADKLYEKYVEDYGTTIASDDLLNNVIKMIFG